MTAYANKFAGNADALVGMGDASSANEHHAGGTGAHGEGSRVPAGRILNQLARELLLAQSSDWAFQIYQGTTVEYSSRRFQSHIHRFDLLAKMLDCGDVDHELLNEIENRDNIFAEIDFRVYAG